MGLERTFHRNSKGIGWRLIAVTAIAVGLSACGTTSLPDWPDTKPRSSSPAEPPIKLPESRDERHAFSARLSGENAVPANASHGGGELLAAFDETTMTLRWKLTYFSLSGPVTRADFHSPGMEDEVAPQVLSLGDRLLSPTQGQAVLTRHQAADLLAGQWYLNVSTQRHPDGEVRGQLIEAQ